MADYESLLAKIESSDALVGIVGLGYVGLPLSMAFADGGFRVLGFDVEPHVVDGLRHGRSHVGDVPDDSVAAAAREGRFDATSDFDRLREPDAVIICVPTPLSKAEDPDLSFVLRAIESLVDVLRPGQLVVLESTTYPGTTRDLLAPALEASGLELGKNVFAAFSPERVDPGNAEWDIRNTPKLVAGLTPACHALAVRLYDAVIEHVVPVSSPEVAELAKILENTFRAVNIGLANEMALIADRLGIDVWEVIDAASTKPYGYMRFYPGPGLGGHCIPVDPLFLSWKMRSLQYRTRFIELAAEINSAMPRHVVERSVDALNAAGKPVNGSRVLVIGVSYKPNVADTRESPAVDIIELLWERGATVHYHDPHVPELTLESGTLHSVPLEEAEVSAADLVVVVTDHDDVDYEMITSRAALIVDPRNAIGDPGEARVYPIAGPPVSKTGD